MQIFCPIQKETTNAKKRILLLVRMESNLLKGLINFISYVVLR